MDEFGGMPPELQAELNSILTRQKIAAQMASRGAGGYLGAMGNARLATADKDMQGFAGKYNQGLQAAVQAYSQQAQGRPAIDAPTDDLGGGPGRPEIAPDPQGAVTSALMSHYGPLKALGAKYLEHQLKSSDPYTLNEGDQRITPPLFAGGKQTVVTNPKVPEHAIPDTWAESLPEGATRLPTDPPGVYRMTGTDGQKDVYQLEFDRGKLKGSKKLDSSQIVRDANQNFQTTTIQDPLDTSENPRQITVRVGMYDEAKYLKGDKTGVIGVSGKETDRGKREGKRQFNMQGLGGTIQQAEDLLNGNVRDEAGEIIPGKKGQLPTQSGMGSLVDAAGNFVGKTMAGAKEATALKAIAGALTAKMPRMEGPQSDKDTLLYKQMAAQVGDSGLPVDQRVAALDEVKRIWAKYERLNPEAFADRRAAPKPGGAGWGITPVK